MATALAVRDRIVDRWLSATRAAYENGQKQVYYLSLEFLIGRLLRDGVTNLGLTELVHEALAPLGVDLEKVRQAEPDAALGNGGLGRLAACFMESLASLGIPAFGYGIRYEHGLFRQIIRDGWQNEYPEDWLTYGNPWEFARPEISHDIGFGGVVEAVVVSEARVRHVWHPAETVQAVAYDTPVVGWRGEHVNTLRLWSARAADPLKLEAFNYGDHLGALADRVAAGEHLQGALPVRREPGRAGAAAASRNTSSPPPRCRTCVRRHLRRLRRPEVAAGPRGDPAQRHPPGHRRAGADAHLRRRARHPLGRGLGDHPGHASATPTTPCCRRRWKAGRCR